IKRSAIKDKGKATMQESESLKKIKKKEMVHISLDEEIAQRFVPIESEGQKADSKARGSSKEGKSLKRLVKEELGQEQQVEEEIVQQDDVAAKQVEKESSQKARRRLKRKTSKAREDKDKRQKKQDDLEKLTLVACVEVVFDSKEVISMISLAVESLIVNYKSYCKGDVGYYEIHRADGSYKTYIFSEMLMILIENI
nr:hypothetical protein [Tanacetum cinerariifolium]